MIRFDIELNGEPYCRAGIDAEAQAGEEPPPSTPIHWRDVNRGLRVGDELRIRIVEVDEADDPTATPQLPPLPGE